MGYVGLSNYEINQQAYLNVPTLTHDQIAADQKTITTWLSAFSNCTYVGTLCREKYDFTLVHVNNKEKEAIQEVMEILQSRGEIVDIIYVSAEKCYQIWVREEYTESIKELEENSHFKWTPQVWMYMVFDASDWVIDV